MDLKLEPKVPEDLTKRATFEELDTQISAIPEYVEVVVVDAEGKELESDCSGFFLNQGKLLT